MLTLVWDVTCTDTLASSHLSLSLVVSGAGAVALDSEHQKKLKYSHIGVDVSHWFIMMAVKICVHLVRELICV